MRWTIHPPPPAIGKLRSQIVGLEAQQRYFAFRAILVAIVSQNSFVLVFNGVSHKYRAIRGKMGCRTDVPVQN